MRIVFIRHGDDKADKLTLRGRIQAKMAVRQVDYEEIEKVYSSPSKRALDTAKIIAKKLGKKVVVDQRIDEREKLSPNMTEDQALAFNTNYLNPKFSRQHPEGCKEYKKRVFEFLDEVVKNSKDDCNILIVGHSSMTYILGAYFFETKDDKDLVWMRLGNCSKLCFEYKKV